MHVRRAESQDSVEWLRMRTALWPDCSPEEHAAEMAEFAIVEAPLAIFVAVHPKGDLGGFLEASLRDYADGCDTRPVGYIEGWYVDPDLRQQGVGRLLILAAEEWARVQGCQEIASDCLLDNVVGLQAHLALGFQETERLIHLKKRLI
jgi:aminoglycoside 6'-N-acetyltransferase I